MRKSDDVSKFAIELNRLCDERWPGGDRHTNVLISDWVTDQIGRVIDRQYIWRIRKGRVAKVDAEVHHAICSFFGVPNDHFTTASRRSLGEEVEHELERTGLRIAGLRSDQLTEAGRNDVARLLRELGQILEAEKKDEA